MKKTYILLLLLVAMLPDLRAQISIGPEFPMPVGSYERWNKGGGAASHMGLKLAYAFSASILTSTSTKSAASNPTQSLFDSTYKIHITYDKTSTNWQKHKTFQALGWTSLGIGVPLTLLGLVTTIANAYNGNDNPTGTKVMLGAGAVLTASSIPLFIFSHKYKKRAY